MNLDDIRDALRAVHLERLTDHVIQGALPAIHLTHEVADERELPIGTSKFGGCPDLPPDLDWPMNRSTPLTFLAQFDLTEVAPFDAETLLPPIGMLSFFYDSQSQPWGIEPDDRGGWRVLYSNPPAGTRQRLGWPRALPKFCQLASYQIEYSKRVTLPDWSELPMGSGWTSDEMDVYLQLAEAFMHGSQLLGNPYPLVRRPQLLCEVYSRGTPDDIRHLHDTLYSRVYPEQWLDDTQASIAQHWRLLLQLNNVTGLPPPLGYEDLDDPELDLSRVCDAWARQGLMSFWIQRDRLAEHDFSDVWLLCGSEF